MRQRIGDSGAWSDAIQISAKDGLAGKDGSDIEYVYYRSEAA
jgi:hypothetical protein